MLTKRTPRFDVKFRKQNHKARGFTLPQRDPVSHPMPTRQSRAPQSVVAVGVPLAEARRREREDRDTRSQRRRDAFPRRGLTNRQLKHDGSTREQRLRRIQPTTTPWVAA